MFLLLVSAIMVSVFLRVLKLVDACLDIKVQIKSPQIITESPGVAAPSPRATPTSCCLLPVLVRLSWHLNCQAAQVLDCGIGPVNGSLFALAGLRARTRTNSSTTIATKDANVAGSQQFVLELR